MHLTPAGHCPYRYSLDVMLWEAKENQFSWTSWLRVQSQDKIQARSEKAQGGHLLDQLHPLKKKPYEVNCLQKLVFLKAKGMEIRVFFYMRLSHWHNCSTHINDHRYSEIYWMRGRGYCLYFRSWNCLHFKYLTKM